MTLQVLISTMNQTDHSLLERINIQSDAVVVNQCDHSGEDIFYYKDYLIKWISMPERGVGLSRNTCLMHSTADIVLFADDDITYQDGYAEAVLAAFENNENADVMCFNIKLQNSSKNIGGHRDNQKSKRLFAFNSMRYGATLIAARRKTLFRERISFSLLFGGGAEFSCGEDSIFVKDCLNAKLKLYAHTYCLGVVDDSQSSWYRGIDDAFFRDRGMLYAMIFPRIKHIIQFYYAFRLTKLDKRYNQRVILRLFREGADVLEKYR